jgi:cobyrinic acid a,c-diamide synthase
LPDKIVLPSRHLGLITPDEFENKPAIIEDLRKIVEENINLKKLLEIAHLSPPLEQEDYKTQSEIKVREKVKIGYFRDQAFSFYYPENLEALRDKSAELIAISAIHDTSLDDVDALYIGGGFPETNIAELELNRELMSSLKFLADNGLPVYAECGGLMYLAEDVEWKQRKYELTGVLPLSIKMHSRPQGHGYYRAVVEEGNPFFKAGTQLNGHEFHYSEAILNTDVKSTLSVIRGNGCFNRRDGLTYKNVFASYLHIHALATPEWADGMIKCAGIYKKSKNIKTLIEG